MVSIIDYGLGNLKSVKKALDFINVKSIITNDKCEIMESDAIILPGVGSFDQGMSNLENLDLIEFLSNEVLVRKKFFFGICLGFQLMFEKSFENGLNYGLGWLKGDVIKIESGHKVPHMGWNNIRMNNEEKYIDDLQRNYYFVHSYHVVPDDKSIITSYVYNGIDIVSSIKRENIFGTQFHPEKSQKAGLELLTNFFRNVKEKSNSNTDF